MDFFKYYFNCFWFSCLVETPTFVYGCHVILFLFFGGDIHWFGAFFLFVSDVGCFIIFITPCAGWITFPLSNIFHGVIPFDSRLCIAGCNTVETSTHLFLHCPMFGAVWYLLFRWLGVSTAIPLGVVDHFNQFFLDGGNVKARGAILHAIWFATTWEIWKERNNRLFNGKQSSIPNVVDKIKSIAFMWLKEKYPSLPFNYHVWWLSPFTILGVG